MVPGPRRGVEPRIRYGFSLCGVSIAPEVPARLIARVLASDANGEVISIYDARGRAFLNQAD